MRLVQINGPDGLPRVGVVENNTIHLIDHVTSVYHLAVMAINAGDNLISTINRLDFTEQLDYDKIYTSKSDWKIRPSFDVPGNPEKMLVSGTGLTHKASAENREIMHQAQFKQELSDSMKMYLKGVNNGAPADGQIGVQPEWFYKGNGSIVRGHRDTLEVPAYALDGGEEAEIAAIYICDQNGLPFRLGFTPANEFSDHVMEKENYLYLAPSKIRNCAIGPELLLTNNFEEYIGKVEIIRNRHSIWSKKLLSGNKHMAHSLENLEYHHFKYQNNRLPFQAHIHFLGASAFSFGDKIFLQDGDEMIITWDGMGRSLINVVSADRNNETKFTIQRL